MSLLIDLTKSVRGKDIEKVSPRIQQARMGVCNACPHQNRTFKSCGGFLTGGKVIHEGEEKELCGCYLPDKTTYKDDGCPLGKW